MNNFCPIDCEYLSITEQQQDILGVKHPHVCTKYGVKLYHMLAHPFLYKCEDCRQGALKSSYKNFNKNSVLCPDCKNVLKLMSLSEEDNRIIALYSCESCPEGFDKDWKVTYSPEKILEKIERHFWG